MAALQFPCTIFKTKKWMDDYSAGDMYYGDLSAAQLKTQFNLVDVSTRANPYSLTKITPFNQPQSMFYGSHGEGKKITRQECAKILFDEFRHLSKTFAIYGPYKVQDHFGLDNDDISNFKFNHLNFFRIWFVLQRYSKFGFKPFMTNIKATVEITGKHHES